MDWLLVADPELASAFGVRPPTGGSGPPCPGWSRDYMLVDPAHDEVLAIPDGVDDDAVGKPAVAGRTAAAALAAIGLRAGDTVLIGLGLPTASASSPPN